VAVADEQGTLQGEGDGFGDKAGAAFRVVTDVRQFLAVAGDGLVQAVIGAGGQVELIEQRLDARRITAEGATTRAYGGPPGPMTTKPRRCRSRAASRARRRATRWAG
jgi:hypothetical protein